MEVWELNLLHDGDIEQICMCSDEQPLFEMAVDRAFNLFAKMSGLSNKKIVMLP